MKWLWLPVFLFSSLFAQIQEIRTISEMRGFLEDPEALIVFDIDNTILETTQMLGSDQWFVYRQKEYLDRGYSAQEALEIALAEWMAIQNLTRVQLVERETREFIAELQASKRTVMGLTTRGLGLSTRTIEQLHALEVDLSKTAPDFGEVLFVNERGVLFRKGILFTAGTHKGKAFLRLFEGNLPSKVVFINDKATHLRQVEESCEAAGIAFVGLRYGFLDEKVKSFSPEVAAVQWDHFGKLISDEVAQREVEVKNGGSF